MAQIQTSEKGMASEALSGKPVERSFVKTAGLFNRPILTGFLSLLVILGYCQSYGTSVNPSYSLSRNPEAASIAPPRADSETDPNGESSSSVVPLLFLSFIGLAGMALSRTGASRETEVKDLSVGQKNHL